MEEMAIIGAHYRDPDQALSNPGSERLDDGSVSPYGNISTAEYYNLSCSIFASLRWDCNRFFLIHVGFHMLIISEQNYPATEPQHN
jgi:hypothetical protein